MSRFSRITITPNRKARYRTIENHLGRRGEGSLYNRARLERPVMSLHAYSLVANVLPFNISSKVVTIKDFSRLRQDSDTHEHDIPGVPAQGATTCIYMCVCVCLCAHMYTYCIQNSQGLEPEHFQV